MKHTRILALFAVALLLFGCTGCKIPFLEDLMGAQNLIPARVNFVVTVKVADLYNDPDFQSQLQKSGMQEIDELKEEYGIDISQVSKMIVFGDSSAMSNYYSPFGSFQQAYAGALVYAPFNEAEIVSKLKADGDVTEDTYEGFTLYTSGSSSSPSATAFIDGKVIVSGSVQAVKDVISVKVGKAQPLSNADMDVVSANVNSNALFTAVAVVPSDLRTDLRKQSQGPMSAQAFSNVDTAGLSVNKAGDSVEIRVAFLCDDPAGAEKVGDLIGGTAKMAKGMVQSGSAAETLLDAVEVSTSGSLTFVKLDTTKRVLEDVQSELGGLSQMMTPYS